MKKRIPAITIVLCIMMSTVVFSYNEAERHIYIFGKDTLCTSILESGTTLIPLRKICEALDCTVLWNEEDRSVTIEKDDMCAWIQIGKRNAYFINGGAREDKELLFEPIIYNDLTFVPLRFISESLGFKVIWDENTGGIAITDMMSLEEFENVYGQCKSVIDDENKMTYRIYDTKDVCYIGVRDGQICEIFSANPGFLSGKKRADCDISEVYYYNAFGSSKSSAAFAKNKQAFIDAQNKLVFYAINAVREKMGLSKLEWSDDIAKIDVPHVTSMAENGYFSHTGSDGDEFTDRYKKSGIKAKKVSENLARVPNVGVAVKDWLASKSHREALLNADFSHTGVASYFKDGESVIYYAQIFMVPRGEMN